MGKMKVAVLYRSRDVRLENVRVPKIKPNWFLLKVRAVGMCESDLHLYKEKIISSA